MTMRDVGVGVTSFIGMKSFCHVSISILFIFFIVSNIN